MIILSALLAFVLPLLLRRFFIIIQGFMAFVWIIIIVNIPNTFSTNELEYTMHRILYVALPLWIFSSLIVLSIRTKYVESNIFEKLNKSEVPNFDYEISKADENECPICFSMHDKNQKQCANCGHTFNDLI